MVVEFQDYMHVCENGHKITGQSIRHREEVKPYCPDCGAKAVTKCPACDALIPGYTKYAGIARSDHTKPPNNCQYCGTAFPWNRPKLAPATPLQKPAPLSIVERILARFHAVAIRLQGRHNNRQTLKIEDEYDVQDLLQALLVVSFDDVRMEEPSPSVAGAGTRLDVVLKDEGIIIEAKFANPKHGAKQIGSELLIDIARYEAYPDCHTLVCFIYDPNHCIANRAGLIKDLEQRSGRLKVRVIINP